MDDRRASSESFKTVDEGARGAPAAAGATEDAEANGAGGGGYAKDGLQLSSEESAVLAVRHSHELTSVADVTSLCEWFHAAQAGRLRDQARRAEDGGGGAATAVCGLLTAPPAAGKSCMMSQLVIYTLERMRTRSGSGGAGEGEALVPILVRVQDLQAKLLSDDEHAQTAFASKWNWIDGYLSIVHGAQSELYLMLRQAMMARRVLLLLDGVDEGGSVRTQIEQHIVEVLAPQGLMMLVSARTNGVDYGAFVGAGFQELRLRQLTHEQQLGLIRRRLPQAEQAEQLIAYVTEKIPQDEDTGEKVTANPLMLSMVANIFLAALAGGAATQQTKMPETITELYHVATSSMLAKLDPPGGSAGAPSPETEKIKLLLEAIFYQAHVAETRTVEEEHVWKAALNLSHSLETPEAWLDAERRIRSADTTFVAKKLAPAWRAAAEAVCTRLREDSLPLLSLLSAAPLKAQSSHLSFQEFFAARSVAKFGARVARGDRDRPAHVWSGGSSKVVPWELSEWWANALRLGEEMGVDFAAGLLKAAGMTGVDHLDLRAHLLQKEALPGASISLGSGEGGHKTGTAFSVVALLMQVVPSFDLRDNGITPLEARVLFKGLANARSVKLPPKAVLLGGNHIGPAATRELAVAITQGGIPEAMLRIDLGRSRICGLDEMGRGKFDPIGLTELAAAFLKCTKLAELNLARNCLGDDGGVLLIESFGRVYRKVKPALTSLNLSHNGLGVEATNALSQLLIKSKFLTTLDLSHNRLDAECAKTLGKVFGMSHLHVIDLSCNQLCQGPDKASAAAAEMAEESLVWIPKEDPSAPFATSARPFDGDGGGFSRYLWTAEGIHAIAEAVNDVPWRLQLKLNDNCLCGLASFYLDAEWTVLGAYTSLAFDALVKWLEPSKTTKYLVVEVEDNHASLPDRQALLNALKAIPDDRKLRASQELFDEEGLPPMPQALKDHTAKAAAADGSDGDGKTNNDGDGKTSKLAAKFGKAMTSFKRTKPAAADAVEGVADVTEAAAADARLARHSKEGSIAMPGDGSSATDAAADRSSAASSSPDADTADAATDGGGDAEPHAEPAGGGAASPVDGDLAKEAGNGGAAAEAAEAVDARAAAAPPSSAAESATKAEPAPKAAESKPTNGTSSKPTGGARLQGGGKGGKPAPGGSKQGAGKADDKKGAGAGAADRKGALGGKDGSGGKKGAEAGKKEVVFTEPAAEAEPPAETPPPERFQTSSVLKVRASADPASDAVMNLPKGSVLIIIETQEQPDKSVRGLVQLAEAAEPLGWITTTKADGSSSLVKLVVEAKALQATVEHALKRASFETVAVLKCRKESDPKSELVSEGGLKAGNLPKGSAVHVLKREPQPDKSERGQIKFVDSEEPLGWITTIKADGTNNLNEKRDEPAAAVMPSGSGGGDAKGAGGASDGKGPDKGADKGADKGGDKGADKGDKKKPKDSVKVKTELTKPTVPEKRAQELHRQMKPPLDKNGLVVWPGVVKRKVDAKDENSAKSRHDEAPPLDVDDGIKLMFNLAMSQFRVASEDEDVQVPESDTFSIYARNGKPVGKVKIPPSKGQALEERVVFDAAWLDGESYGLQHLAAQGQAILEVAIKTGDKKYVPLIVSPWLAYSCSLGARFLIRKFGETQGRIGTVKRVMNDDRIVIHVDGTDPKDVSSLVTIEPRPDTVLRSTPVRHKVGTLVQYLKSDNPATAACVDAIVAEIPMDKWKGGAEIVDENGFRVPDGEYGARHWLQLKSSSSLVEAVSAYTYAKHECRRRCCARSFPPFA